MTDLEAIDQALADRYYAEAMDSVRDLLDGCVEGGRYVAPERRASEEVGGEAIEVNFLLAGRATFTVPRGNGQTSLMNALNLQHRAQGHQVREVGGG